MPLTLVRTISSRRVQDLVALIILFCTALLAAIVPYRFSRTAAFTMGDAEVLLPRDGFFQTERFPDNAGFFSWAEGSGVLKLPNPGGETALQIEMLTPSAEPISVTIRAEQMQINFVVLPGLRRYAIVVPPSNDERITLTIDSPQIQARKRKLGVGVADIALKGGGPAPVRVLLGLLFATLGGYTLLRQSGQRTMTALIGVLALQVLVMLWNVAGGWRYAWLGSALPLLGGAALAAVAIERWWPGIVQRRARAAAIAPATPAWSRADTYALAGLLVVAIGVRLLLLFAPDPVGDLELSARRMGFLYAGGLTGAFTAGGDYLPLRLYWLRELSKLVPLLGGGFIAPLPRATILLIKLPGLLADLATAIVIYRWSRRWRTVGGAALITALYTLAPPIWINVAWWGQIDAVLMLALVGAVLLLDRAEGRWSWLCWAAAMLIKSQAIVFAPLLFISTLRRYGTRGLVNGAALASGLIGLACAPFVLAGQGSALAQAYVGSTDRFPRTTVAAYNLWFLLLAGDSSRDTNTFSGSLSYRMAGFILLGIAALLVCIALLRRSDGPARVESAAVLALAFFCFPTQIHERYLFLVLAFLALRLPSAPRLLLPYVVLLVTATLNILGTLQGFTPAIYAAMQDSNLPLVLAALNLLMFGVLIVHLLWAAREPG